LSAVELAKSLADGGRVQELASDKHRLFRIARPEGTSLLKVYISDSWSRREERALNAVSGMTGVPHVIDRGITNDLS